MLEATVCTTASEELASLAIFNAVWPHDAVTIQAVHAYRDSALHYVDHLVRDGGVTVGSGTGAIFAYRPERVESLINVIAEHRGRGAGAALYGAVSRWADARGARELEVSVAGNDTTSLSVARRHGFVEDRHEMDLVLDLGTVAHQQVRLPDGVEIATWAQRPELARAMYEVNVECRPDIPGFDDATGESFEDWLTHRMQRPADSPEATFIALAGAEVVGYAKLSLTPPTAGHAMTAVRRAWRGRGIAGALKATEINWALAHGYSELHTSNEDRNAPMRRVNDQFGYRPGIGRTYLVGPLLA